MRHCPSVGPSVGYFFEKNTSGIVHICMVFLPNETSNDNLDDFVCETSLGIEHIDIAFLSSVLPYAGVNSRVLQISSSTDHIDVVSLLCELLCERLIPELYERILCIVHSYEV